MVGEGGGGSQLEMAVGEGHQGLMMGGGGDARHKTRRGAITNVNADPQVETSKP